MFAFHPLCHALVSQLLHLQRVLKYCGGGANTTITALWNTICMLIETGRMPKDKRLMIQLDGASDNVNHTMLRFASWLCQQKICRTVSSDVA